MDHFVPHSPDGIQAHQSLLAELQTLAPPGCDEEDLLQLADTVIDAILTPMEGGSEGAAGGSSGGVSTTYRLALNDALGMPVTMGQVGVIVDLCKQLAAEFVSKGGAQRVSFEESERVGGGGALGSKRGRGTASGLLSLEEEDDGESSADEEEEEELDEEARTQKALKKMLSLGALADEEEERDFDRGGPRVDGTSDAGMGGGSLALTMKAVQSNPNYIADYVDPLIPNIDPARRADTCTKIRRFLSDPREMASTVESQLMSILQPLVFAGAATGNEDGEEEERLEREYALTDTVSTLVQSRWAIVFGLQYAEAREAAKVAFTQQWGALPESSRTEAAEQELRAVIEQEKINRVTDLLKEHGLIDPAVRALYGATTGLELTVDATTAATTSGANATLDKQTWDRKHRVLHQLDLDAMMRGGEQHGRRPTMIGGLSGLSVGQSHLRPKVPKGTIRSETDTYEEIKFPPCDTYNKTMKELEVAEAFPAWARLGFSVAGVKRLNPMQTHVHHSAFETDDNMLVCAPTGAGKTNVALMSILRVLDNFKANATGDSFRYDDFKIVYIAPMKALVQEVVQTFSHRLEPYGISVAELSGDSGLSKEQLARTQMIVATPEKWDIVTRKSIDLGVATFVKLIIIDEVHLLHNDRGPILESVVARTALMNERSNSKPVRLVGLSATVPNREDVAEFLKVDRTKGLHYFDSKFRPVPLQQTYCAVKQVPGKLPATVLNTVAYDKLMEFRGQSTMIFVHSRKDTEFTAKFLIDMARSKNRLDSMLIGAAPPGEPTIEEVVEAHSNGLRDSLKEMLPLGFGVHHAGLTKEERNIVEKLFLEKQIRVLVSTSTLAWGVNLPAHAVIIKGTQIYNPEKGGKAPLSALDVLQMFGRAGRKGFDTSGSACIITTPEDVYYYLCILNNQIPIESQFTNHLVDALNAEVALGTITTVDEGARWLQHTYHYVRCKRDPLSYSVVEGAYGTVPGGTASPEQRKLLASLRKPGGASQLNNSPFLLELLRENLIHTAATILSSCKLIDYDRVNKVLRPTPLGRIASTFFVHYRSIEAYNRHLTAHMGEIDIFHLFTLSSEFRKISVRKDERAELQKLIENCPLPVKEPFDISSGANKINVLLQAYITGADLKGLALMTEMAYIQDSAQRILKALYEICVVKDFGATSRRVHEVYQMVLRRQWSVLCPARQLQGGLRRAVLGGNSASVDDEPGAPSVAHTVSIPKLRELNTVLSEVEKRPLDFEWRRVRNPANFTGIADFAETFFNGNETKAATLVQFMRMVPWLDVSATTRPLTSSQVHIEVSIAIDVDFYAELHAAMGGELIVQLEDPSTASVAHSSATSSGTALIMVGSGVEQSMLRRNILYYESTDAMSLMRGSVAKGSATEPRGAAEGDSDDGANAAAEDEEDARPRLTISIVAPIPSHPLGGRAQGTIPCHYFLHVSLASWLGCSVTLPIDLQSIFFPAPPPPTAIPEARNVEDSTLTAVLEKAGCSQLVEAASSIILYEQLYAMQIEVVPSLLINGTRDTKWSNVFIGMPAGTGKTFCAELLALRLSDENTKLGESMSMLYITATAPQAQRRYDEWTAKFSSLLGHNLYLLSGHARTDAAVIAARKPLIILCCAGKLQPLVASSSSALRQVRYVVADHLHLLGKAGEGRVYESVLSRIAPPTAATKPYLLNNGAHPRVLALSYTVRYPGAFASWLKVPSTTPYSPTHGNCFNYNVLALRRLQIGVEGIDIPGSRNRLGFAQARALKQLGSRPDKYGSDLAAIAGKATATTAVDDGPSPSAPRTVVFVQTAADAAGLAMQFATQYRDLERARTTLDDLTALDDAEVEGEEEGLSVRGMQRVFAQTIADRTLQLLLMSGVGYLHGSLVAGDEQTLLYALETGAVPLILFAPFDISWRLPAAVFDNAIVVGAEKPVSAATRFAENSVQPFRDCTVAELSQMVSRAELEATVYCRSARAGMWSALLTNAVAVESTHIESYDFEEAVNSAVADGVVTSVGGVLRVLQRHYGYHHALTNPSLYDIPVPQFGEDATKQAVHSALSAQCDEIVEALAAAKCLIFDPETGSVRPTPTGIAISHHTISLDTLRQLQATASDLAERGEAVSLKRWLRMLCATAEVTAMVGSSSSGVHPAQRSVLQILGRELPDEALNAADVDFTSAEGKCSVLVAVELSSSFIDPVGIVKSALAADGPKGAALAEITLTELLREGREVLNACRRVCAAAVEALALLNTSLSLSMILVHQALSVECLPGCAHLSGGIVGVAAACNALLVSNTPFPLSVAREVRKLPTTAEGGIQGTTAVSTSELDGLVSTSEPVSNLRALMRAFMASAGETAEAADKKVVNALLMSTFISKATSIASADVNLQAQASVAMHMGQLHLAINVEFDNAFAITSPFLEVESTPHMTVFVVCFDPASSAVAPTFGMMQVELPMTVATDAEKRVTANFTVPVPEVDDDADVNLQCALIHGTVLDFEFVGGANADAQNAALPVPTLAQHTSLQQQLRAMAAATKATTSLNAGTTQPHTEINGGFITSCSSRAVCEVAVIGGDDDEE